MLLDILPKDYVYRILKSTIISDQQFHCEIRCNVSSEETFNKWLREFEYVTDTTWIPEKSAKRSMNPNFVFSKNYVCLYSANRKNQNAKKSKNCTASLIVQIKVNNKDACYRDPLLRDGYCAFIKINFHHNHKVIVAETLNRPPISELEPQKVSSEIYDSDIIPSSPVEYHELTSLPAASQQLNIAANCMNSVDFPENWLEDNHKRDNQESVNKSKHSKIIDQFLDHMAKIATLVEESNDNELLNLMEIFTERAANIQTISDLCDFLHPHED